MLRNRLFYLWLCIGLGYFSILYNERVTMIIALMVILFPVVSLFLMIYLRRKIKIVLKMEPSIVNRHEQCIIRLWIEDKSIFPVSRQNIQLYAQNSIDQVKEVRNLSLSCMGRSKQIIELHITPEYSGEIKVWIEKVSLWDYSNCTCISIPVDEACNLLVMPNEFEMKEKIQIGSMRLFENESAILPKPGTHPTEILDIREYKPGDQISKIHWKLTSKYDELMVKEYASPLYYYPLFLIDTRIVGQIERDCIECLFELVLDFSVWHYECECPFEIAYYDVVLNQLCKQTINSKDELCQVLQFLFRNCYQSDQSQCLLQFHFEEEFRQYSDIVYMTLDITEEANLPMRSEVFTICVSKDTSNAKELYEKFEYGTFMLYEVGKGEEEILRAAEEYLHRGRG